MTTTSFEYEGVTVEVRVRRERDNLLSPTLCDVILTALKLTFDDVKLRPAVWIDVSFFVSVILQARPSQPVAWWADPHGTTQEIFDAYQAFWAVCENDDTLLEELNAAFGRVDRRETIPNG